VNLPNALTVARIAVTPLLAWLPLMTSATARFGALMLFLIAAWSDYYDGKLARTRGLVTDFGKTMDPLADKLLLLGTFVPMFYLQAPTTDPVLRLIVGDGAGAPAQTPFLIALGGDEASWSLTVWFHWWIAAVVLGREVLMTMMRQMAARRGTIISAIGSAKLKTVFQLIWIGAAYLWFFLMAVTPLDAATHTGWRSVTNLCAGLGAVTMAASVVLTVYSMGVYVVRFGPVFGRAKPG
jgi:phosphatidylglycerophosphate synthase